MNKNSISGCMYFFLHRKSKDLVVRICKSVRIIGRSLRANLLKHLLILPKKSKLGKIINRKTDPFKKKNLQKHIQFQEESSKSRTLLGNLSSQSNPLIQYTRNHSVQAMPDQYPMPINKDKISGIDPKYGSIKIIADQF